MPQTYYDSKLEYAMSDANVRTCPFRRIVDDLFELFQAPPLDRSPPFNLTLKIMYVPVEEDSALIQDLYSEGKVRSHEKKELVQMITKKVGTALKEKSEAVFETFTKLLTFKTRLEVNFSGRFLVQRSKKPLKVFYLTLKIRELIEVPISALKALITQFQIKHVGLCEEVKYYINIDNNVRKSAVLPFEYHEESDTTLTKSDKEMVMEFFAQEEVKNILFSYFFPHGIESTEITWDSLKVQTPVQKRRKIKRKTGDYINLHDVLTPFTPHEEFLQIIEDNDIAAFYPSVRASRTKNLVTILIDIDMSSFLKKFLGLQGTWEFTLAIAQEIIKNAMSFGLPRPLIVFSGSRGVHLIWRVAPTLVKDTFNYINDVKIFLFPGQKMLQKNPKSIMHSKFAFIRRITEALLLYTIHYFDLEKIPKKIQQLGLMSRHDLFKLSPFDDNAIAVLLDTSTQNASVHRVFSFHLSSKLISIPITIPETFEIDPRFYSYEILKEEANPETVINNLKQGDVRQYRQFPPEITAAHVENLLKPGKGILAIMATMLRFSDRWITSRSHFSFSFWEQMYEITTFYDYLKRVLMSLNLSKIDFDDTLLELTRLIGASPIILKNETKRIIYQFLNYESNYKAAEIQLESLKNFEFLTQLKPQQLKAVVFSQVKDLLEDEGWLRYFINQFAKIHAMMLTFLIHDLGKMDQLKDHEKSSILKLKARLNVISNQLNRHESLGERGTAFLSLISHQNAYLAFFGEHFLNHPITQPQVKEK